MKKGLLFGVLLFSVFIMVQSCKKSSSDDTSTTTTDTTTVLPFSAYVNAIQFAPVTTSAVLTYSATNKTKTLVITSSGASDKISLTVIQPSSKIDSGFTVRLYSVDTVANNVLPVYYSTVNNTLTQVGTVKSGYISVSAIDSIKKVITGTFSFSQIQKNYDTNHNLISITSTSISSGAFNSFPYTFKKQ